MVNISNCQNCKTLKQKLSKPSIWFHEFISPLIPSVAHIHDETSKFSRKLYYSSNGHFLSLSPIIKINKKWRNRRHLSLGVYIFHATLKNIFNWIHSKFLFISPATVCQLKPSFPAWNILAQSNIDSQLLALYFQYNCLWGDGKWMKVL